MSCRLTDLLLFHSLYQPAAPFFSLLAFLSPSFPSRPRRPFFFLFAQSLLICSADDSFHVTFAWQPTHLGETFTIFPPQQNLFSPRWMNAVTIFRQSLPLFVLASYLNFSCHFFSFLLLLLLFLTSQTHYRDSEKELLCLSCGALVSLHATIWLIWFHWHRVEFERHSWLLLCAPHTQWFPHC